MTAELDSLGAAEYALLTTFRKDGTPVGTPVWLARADQELLVWTVTGSWKVKRIGRDPRVLLATCDFRGKPKGEPVSGTARVLDAAGTARAREVIAKKYGIKGRITMAVSKLRRGTAGTVGLSITLD